MVAARSAGNIELTVNADTGRLTAQLVKGGTQAGKAGADAISKELSDLDTKKLQANLKVLKKKIEAELSNIEANVGLDDSELNADLKRLQQRLRAAQLELQVSPNIDETELEDDIAVIRKRISLIREDIKVGAVVNPADIKKLERQIEVLLGDIDARVDLQAEFDQVNLTRVAREMVADIEAQMGEIEVLVTAKPKPGDLQVVKQYMEAVLGDIDAAVSLGVPPGEIAFAREYMELRLKDIDADIEAKVDQKALAKAITQLKTAFSGGGEDAGDEFGGGVGRGLSQRTKLIAGGIALLLEPAFVAVQDLASAITAVLGSAVNGLISGIGAAAPVIAGFGAAIAAVVVGSKGFGTAMSAVNAEMADAASSGRAFNISADGITGALATLTPSARDAALAFASIRTRLAEVQDAVQERLFEDFDGVIASLAVKTLPSMSKALQGAATEVNTFGKDVSRVANNTDFAGIFTAIQPAVNAAFGAITQLVATVEPFLKAAAPAGQKFAEGLERAARALRSLVENNPDRIDQFLRDGIDSLGAWWDLTRNIGDALGTLFRAGQQEGDGFVQRLANIVGVWDDWMESFEGQNALEGFFEGGRKTMDALKPVVKALADAFSTIVTGESRDRLDELFQTMADAIPVLAEVIVQIGRLNILESLLGLIVALGPILDLIEMLGPAVMEVIGTMIILSAAVVKVAAGFKALALLEISPWLLAITAAVAVATVAFRHFSDSQEDVTSRTGEVASALRSEVEALIETGDAATAAAGGIDSMNKALVGSGAEGDKLASALGRLGLTTDDATDSFIALGEDPVAALKRLGEANGLTADEAARLAKAVNDNDDNFTALIAGMSAVGTESDLTTAEIATLVKQMEELQDQAENTDLSEIARENINIAASADDATQALLAQAEEITGVGRGAADVLPLYTKFTELQIAAAAAADIETEAMKTSQQVREDIIAGLEEDRQAKILLGEASRAAAEEERKLAQDMDRAVRAAADQVGISGDTASALITLGEGARQAAKDADSLSSALDTLLGSQASAQESADALQQNISDLRDQIIESAEIIGTEGADGMNRWGAAIDNTTQIGRDNREQIRESVAGILDYASAAVEAGVSNDEISATVAASTEALRGQLMAFGATETEADDYIATLLGTPGLLETIIATPGMAEALINGDDLNVIYDEAGQPVLTDFSVEGLKESAAATKNYQSQLTGVDDTNPNSEFSANIPENIANAQALQKDYDKIDDTNPDSAFKQTGMPVALKDSKLLQTQMDDIDDTDPVSVFTMTNLTASITNTATLQAQLDEIDETNPDPTITLPGIQARIDDVQRLINKIDGLQNKTVTITTFNRSTGGAMTGAIGEGLGRGQRITFPQTLDVGERGYREAVIPLDLPLNRVDSSVRDMAALIRSGGNTQPAKPTATTVHNNEFHINDAHDAEATATQVMNRMMARL